MIKRNTLAFVFTLVMGMGMAGCASLTAPKSVNGTAAYAGTTLQAVEQTAAAEYPSMTPKQRTAVHGYIKQAETYRDDALQSLQAGNTGAAQTKLQKLAALMGTIQSVLQSVQTKQSNGGA